MSENNKLDFAKNKAKSDEWYTPATAIIPILKYIEKDKIIWCPFDTHESNFVKVLLENGNKVIHTHIDSGFDFFDMKIPECDYIISNPPYSVRNNILNKLFTIGKPFMMLMNTNGLFDSKIRWDMFKNNNFTLLYLSGRVNYMKEYNKKEKSAPPFQSAYICHNFFDEKIIFEDKI